MPCGFTKIKVVLSKLSLLTKIAVFIMVEILINYALIMLLNIWFILMTAL